MRGEAKATTRLIAAAVSILQEQNPMTVRQLFYRLVGTGQIDNTQAEYSRVSRLMTIARKDSRCDFAWIVDRSRPEYSPNVWNDAAAYFETVKRAYRRDCWQDQPCHVEVWTEKDAIIGSIEQVTKDEFGVTVRVFRGFSSTTRANDIEQAFSEIDKPIHVFYLGDHDPSGIDIERDIRERISVPFSIQRIAIHAADIRNFNLPTQKIKAGDNKKKGDSRARNFQLEHGSQCVELDALPPTELRRRLHEAIDTLIDKTPWARHMIAEMAERESITRIANYMKTLPRSNDGISGGM
jgi:hypothetical protein